MDPRPLGLSLNLALMGITLVDAPSPPLVLVHVSAAACPWRFRRSPRLCHFIKPLCTVSLMSHRFSLEMVPIPTLVVTISAGFRFIGCHMGDGLS